MPKRLHERGAWKPVELPATEDIYNDQLFACLNSIEELTDYDFDALNESAELATNEELIDDNAPDGSDDSKVKTIILSKRGNKKEKPTDKGTDDGACVAVPHQPATENSNRTESQKLKRLKKKQVMNVNVNSNSISIEDSSAVNVDEWKHLHLPDRLLEAMKKFSFAKPTDIQQQIVPTAMGSRRDVVGAAETGSGKTLAFLLPVVHHMLRDLAQNILPPDATSTLILAPTRELAQQVHTTLMQLLEYCGVSKSELRSCLIIGGLSREKQQRLLHFNPHIIVGTPGRVWDQFQGGEPCMQHFSTLRYLVIDEADRMVEKGHFPELSEILHVINAQPEAAGQRQNYVFSATLMTIPPRPKRLLQQSKRKIPEISAEAKLENLMQLIGFKPNPKIVDLSRRLLIAHNVRESRVLCSNENKDHILYYLLTTEALKRTLVFCNSIDGVRRLRGVLSHLFPELSSLNKAAQQKLNAGMQAGGGSHHQRPLVILHSKMQQRQRLKYFERFSTREGTIFLCTDVAARGLDFPHVEHVIHYQVPRTFELYVHRSGRTARAHEQGSALLMVAPSEAPLVLNIMSAMKRTESELPILDVDRHVYERLAGRVDLARKIDVREYRTKRDNSQVQWLKRAAHDADIGDANFNDDDNGRARRKNVEHEQEANVVSAAERKALVALKHQLRDMLMEDWKPRTVLSASASKFPSTTISKQRAPTALETTTKRALTGNVNDSSDRETAAKIKRQRLTDGQDAKFLGRKSKDKQNSDVKPVLGVRLMTSKGEVFV